MNSISKNLTWFEENILKISDDLPQEDLEYIREKRLKRFKEIVKENLLSILTVLSVVGFLVGIMWLLTPLFK